MLLDSLVRSRTIITSQVCLMPSFLCNLPLYILLIILHPYLPITATSLQRPLSCVPKVAVVERFNSNSNFSSEFQTQTSSANSERYEYQKIYGLGAASPLLSGKRTREWATKPCGERKSSPFFSSHLALPCHLRMTFLDIPLMEILLAG